MSLIPGTCYYELNQECDDLSNNGAIELNPDALNLLEQSPYIIGNATLYPYTIEIDGYTIHPNTGETLDQWEPESDGEELETYVISNLTAGDSYYISITNANGCQYIATYEIPFISSLDVDITGFCPECQEASNGGIAYQFLTIENLVSQGSGIIEESILTPFSNTSVNEDVDVLYSENSYYDCMYDIDGDGIINSEDDDMDGDGIDNEDDDTISGYLFIDELSGSSISVYPNPSNGIFKIKLSDFDSYVESKIIVRDLKGNLILVENREFMNEMSLDLSFLPKSIYLLNLHINSHTFSHRIILK